MITIILLDSTKDQSPLKKTQQITFTSDTYEAAYEGLRRHEIEHTVRFVAWSSPKFFGNSGKFSFTNIEHILKKVISLLTMKPDCS